MARDDYVAGSQGPSSYLLNQPAREFRERGDYAIRIHWESNSGFVLVVSMWAGTVGAEEQFQTLIGIPTEAMSSTEPAAVEGKIADPKLFHFNQRFFILESLLGKGGLNLRGTLTPREHSVCPSTKERV